MKGQKFYPPQFIIGAATGILVAIIFELINRFIQNTLKYEHVSFYLGVIIALLCLILVSYFLHRIEQLVDKRNYTRFMTSKEERLNLMIDRIKKAKKSIYILSDLSTPDETKLTEHKNYLLALNQAMVNNHNKDGFTIKRLIVPPDEEKAKKGWDWIYEISLTEDYIAHFFLYEKYSNSLKFNIVPQNISFILIDERYLFWKPEISYEEQSFGRIFDGGIYLEDYSREGMKKIGESFTKMYGGNTWPVDVKKLILKKN